MQARNYLAELIGTFALVFCGTGAIVINNESGGAVTQVGIAVTFGLIVAVMIFAFGPISGAHINPAVSIILVLAKRFPAGQLIPYIIAQLAGALAASLLLKMLFPGDELLGSTVPQGSALQSFVLEVVLTMLLALVILNVIAGAKEKGSMPAIAIGATVGLEALFAGPVCGASMNPARSIAPAVVSGHTAELWIYIFAPVAGALAGLLLHKLLVHKHESSVD
jgi:aquaporin NIP